MNINALQFLPTQLYSWATVMAFLGNVRDATKRLRDEKGLTQSELAQMIGVATSTVSAWESGANMLREDAFDKLMDILASPDTLLARELRALADFLDNHRVSKEAKNKRFKAFLEAYVSASRIVTPFEK